MKGSKETLVRGFSTAQVPVQPHARTSSSRNGTEDSALDHLEGVRQCIRRPQRDADTIVQSAPGHSIRGSRNMKGVQPFACI
jgi:hypothetical protein